MASICWLAIHISHRIEHFLSCFSMLLGQVPCSGTQLPSWASNCSSGGISMAVIQSCRCMTVSNLIHDAFFPKQLTVRGSQCFKEWSPWCWMVWSGSRPACLPLPFICLPVLFICLPSSVLVVGFAAGLSPTSFHLSPSSFHLSPRLGACGRVPGLVSHFLSFVSQFFSFVSQFLSFVSPGWVLVVGFPAGLSPTSGHLCPTSFHLSPRLGACGRVPGWLVSHFLSFVSGFPAGLSRTCFHLSPFLSFLCLPGSVLVVGFPLVSHFLSHFFSFVSQFFSLSPRLGACGRVCGWLVSHVVSFVSHFFSFVSQFFSFVSQARCLSLVSHFLSYVSHFFSFFVSQAGCLWSGSRLACLLLPVICLPLLFIFCLPGWVLVVGFPAGLSPTSFHLSPTSFHLSPRVPGWLVSYFLSFVSHFFSFVSQARCLWSGSRLSPTSFPTSFHLSPSSFHCLPGWVLVVGFAAGLSPTSFHLSPTSFHLSPSSFHLGCLWSGSRLACLPLPFICLPLLFIFCLPGWVLVVGFPAGLSPTSCHLFPTSFHFFPKQFTVRGSQCFKEWSPWCWMVWSGSRPACLPLPFSQFFSFVSQAGCLWSGSRLACLPLPFICLPLLFICLPVLFICLGACGRVPGWLVSHFLSFVSHFFSFVSQAGCLWSGSRLACLPLPFTCLPLLFICLPVLFIPQTVYCWGFSML